MKLYGFWRSLATYRVRVALALKGLKADEVSIASSRVSEHRRVSRGTQGWCPR